MNKVDCFLIGHNEGDFTFYEKSLRFFGMTSENYRDLRMNFVLYNDRPHTMPMLINSISGDSGDNQFSVYGDFSLTIASIASYLHETGLSFDYIIDFQRDKQKLANVIEDNNAIVYAITTTLYISAQPIIEIVRFIRSMRNDALIIVGGPFITGECSTYSQKHNENVFNMIGADYWINSTQGEHTLASLIQCIKNGSNINNIPNLIFKSEKQFSFTHVEYDGRPLSESPIRWELFRNHIGKHVSIRTARSCPFSCAYCAFPKHQGAYETLRFNQGVDDLFAILNDYGVESVNIIDDSFNVPNVRFKDILRMKIRNNCTFRWNAFIRCQFLDCEAVSLMRESGCDGVFLGIESADQGILDNMNKNVSVADYVKGMKLLKDAGIATFASFIFGFPGETDISVQKSIAFIRDYCPDFYRIHLWYYDHMTSIHENAYSYDLNGRHYTWSHATMDSRTAQDYIEQSFSEIKESIWMPQYNFDYIGILKMLRSGMSMENIKKCITSFNNCIVKNLNISGENMKNMDSCEYTVFKDSLYAKNEVFGSEESLSNAYN